MIFVDTSGWFAGFVPSDSDHSLASEWFLSNNDQLVTTDYVIDETLTLFRARGEHKRAMFLADRFFEGDLTEVIYLTKDDIKESISIFKQFADKSWSFTDCSSKYICEKYGITHALSFDRHFHQFGTVTVVP
ncbi:MAG: type II toxin-antitoxin system VapC family toxin [Acidobacteria bacterium]|nr:type II toxin-antitoxin system VapC family toxin [Acidobacteriota bacterium]